MSKRSVFTHIAPLPNTITRETAVRFLHDHVQMIEMNPLVIRHGPSKPPPNATQDEANNMTWYEITDEIQYIPGTAVKGVASYKAGFYDLPRGLQTHVFAPGGVDIQAKWNVGGNMPGEEKETVELGVEKPRDGLYIREDVDLKCNVFLANFVKRNLKKSHGSLVERLIKKADLVEEAKSRSSKPGRSSDPDTITPPRTNLLTTPQPYNRSQQTPYSSRNTTPLSHHTQLSTPVCSCLGTRHHPACRYYIDVYQDSPISPPQHQATFPTSQPTSARPQEPRVSTLQPRATYPVSQPATAQPLLRTTTWSSTPVSAYSRTEQDVCYCTGGVHIEGCPSYPGLRLVHSRSSTPPQSDQQTPYHISHSRSYSRPIPPEPQRPSSNGSSISRPQLYGEQAELPGNYYSPMSDGEKSWSSADLMPKPLMTRTAHGHAVVMELEGDMAQRYYEYQAQRAAELE